MGEEEEAQCAKVFHSADDHYEVSARVKGCWCCVPLTCAGQPDKTHLHDVWVRQALEDGDLAHKSLRRLRLQLSGGHSRAADGRRRDVAPRV